MVTFCGPTPNKSLDASGGGVFLNMNGAAKGALIRAAASTQPFDVLTSTMRKQFRFPVVLFLLCLCGSYSDARADICIADRLNVSHITGRVVALVGRIEEPVPNASVELKQLIDDHWVTKFTATSDDKGLFHIDNAPTGKYEMYVTATHFHAFGTRVHLKASKSKPAREIVVTLGPGTHDCGAAQVRRLT